MVRFQVGSPDSAQRTSAHRAVCLAYSGYVWAGPLWPPPAYAMTRLQWSTLEDKVHYGRLFRLAFIVETSNINLALLRTVKPGPLQAHRAGRTPPRHAEEVIGALGASTKVDITTTIMLQRSLSVSPSGGFCVFIGSYVSDPPRVNSQRFSFWLLESAERLAAEKLAETSEQLSANVDLGITAAVRLTRLPPHPAPRLEAPPIDTRFIALRELPALITVTGTCLRR